VLLRLAMPSTGAKDATFSRSSKGSLSIAIAGQGLQGRSVEALGRKRRVQVSVWQRYQCQRYRKKNDEMGEWKKQHDLSLHCQHMYAQNKQYIQAKK
jgi:hypothetical protein